MQALETVIERASLATGDSGDVRDWLLVLLQKEQPVPTTTPLEPATLPPPPPVTDQGEGRRTDPVPAPEAVPEPDRPAAEAVPHVKPEMGPIPQPLANPGAQPSPPRSREQSADSMAAPGSSPTPASSSADLDQAFAPLEIAFPPLPSVEHHHDAVPTQPMAEAPIGRTANQTHPMAHDDLADGQVGGDGFTSPDEPLPDGPTLTPNPERKLQQAFLADFEPHDLAAPEPKFHVEGTSAGDPPPLPRPRQPGASMEVEASAAPTLAAWRAWLPGAFRTRRRS
jgi:hypothetical protein